VDPRLEASGVLAAGGLFYVIFDNLPHIARIGRGLVRGAPENGLIRQTRGRRTGFEDIAHDREADRFFVLIESVRRADGGFMARVQEYDGGLRYRSGAWLDFPLDRPNKGLEGLTCLHREGRTYLLGLCEGNRCRGGAEGRQPGGGRIQVFDRSGRRWTRVGRIRLPVALWFEDYSSLSVDGDRLVVTSQESSAVWVGSLAPGSWEVAGEGCTYTFPRDPDGRVVYCNVEGISWTAADQFVVVSDRAKAGMQDRRCRAKDQSIHVFGIPAR
jgi:hypothetical protein